MSPRSLLISVALLAVAACQPKYGPATGPGNVVFGGGTGAGSGTLSGNGAFSVTSAEENVQNPSDAGFSSLPAVYVYMANVDLSPMCANSDGGAPPPSTFKIAVIGVEDTNGNPIVPGSYNLMYQSGIISFFSLSDVYPDGGSTLVSQAGAGAVNQGSVTFTKVGAQGASGSFSATLQYADGGAAGTMTGSFQAPLCNSF